MFLSYPVIECTSQNATTITDVIGEFSHFRFWYAMLAKRVGRQYRKEFCFASRHHKEKSQKHLNLLHAIWKWHGRELPGGWGVNLTTSSIGLRQKGRILSSFSLSFFECFADFQLSFADTMGKYCRTFKGETLNA